MDAALSSSVDQASRVSCVMRSASSAASPASLSPRRRACDVSPSACARAPIRPFASFFASAAALRGTSAVAAIATAPPMTASRSRVYSPTPCTGMSCTSEACTAAPIAKPGLGWTSRPSRSTTARTTVTCHMPRPNRARERLESSTPKVMPSAVSNTRRGRASRCRPRLVIATVTARKGIGCPSPQYAIAHWGLGAAMSTARGARGEEAAARPPRDPPSARRSSSRSP